MPLPTPKTVYFYNLTFFLHFSLFFLNMEIFQLPDSFYDNKNKLSIAAKQLANDKQKL